MKPIAVLDYGSGNVHSVMKALSRAGACAELTRDPQKIARASGLVVPGVGAYDAVMRQLETVNGAQMIRDRVERKAPVFGICVGLQILYEHGTEHGIHTRGLGLLSGQVGQLSAKKLPHMGWNSVDCARESVLFSGLNGQRFYFVHSYAVAVDEVNSRVGTQASQTARQEPVVSTARHENSVFVASVEFGSLSATQFHPEKSGEAGVKLLQNWIRSLD